MRTRLLLMLTLLFAGFQASAMSVEQSRNEAWFLTDKMAHELRLSSFQWDDVYEVNYDYFRSLGNVFSNYTSINRMREQKLMYILTAAQWNEYRRLSYFNTPCVVVNGNWSFSIYSHYSRDKFFDRNHDVVFTYGGTHVSSTNYYRDRHVTSSNWNHSNNGNHNGWNNGNHNNAGNGFGNSNGNHKTTNGNVNGNRTSSTVSSRLPNTGTSGTHVTQTARRH